MKTYIITVFMCMLFVSTASSQSYTDVKVNSTVTKVQPMTGIVFFSDSKNVNSDAISLEYLAVGYNEIVQKKGVYNWGTFESKLNAIKGRKHQAVIRFYFVDPNRNSGKTTVPDYIKKDRPDFKGKYYTNKKKNEFKLCYFPDWRNAELQRFAKEFYTKFAEKYDNDPRIAFVQTGFGLWAEYHAYDSQITVNGKTLTAQGMIGTGFPSKTYQEEFLDHLSSVMKDTPWSISIDAASMDYSPIGYKNAATNNKPVIKAKFRNKIFGVFNDTFMVSDSETYNRGNWLFFGSDRYKTAPSGGEFGFFDNGQVQGVNDLTKYKAKAKEYYITYVFGNNQKDLSKVREASKASGYKFKIEKFQVSSTNCKVTIKNIGTAPIYYDAHISLNGVKATASLKDLQPGDPAKVYVIPTKGDKNSASKLKILCSRLVPGQEIQFEGNATATKSLSEDTLVDSDYIEVSEIRNSLSTDNFDSEICNIKIIEMSGRVVKKVKATRENIPTEDLKPGMYIISISSKSKTVNKKIMINR